MFSVGSVVAFFVAAGTVFDVVAEESASDGSADHGQVELVCKDGVAKLQRGRWLFGDDTFAKPMDWLEGQDKESSYFGHFKVLAFAAPSAVFTCVPSADCEITLRVTAPWIDKPNGDAYRRLVKIEKVNISGAKIVNGEFKPKTVWAKDPMEFTLAAKRNQPIYVEVAARANVQRTKNHVGTRGHELAKQIRRGVNLSHWLEVPPGEDWANSRCDLSDLIRIKSEGFDHVRVPIGWNHQTGPSPGFALDRSKLASVDVLLKQAQRAGLAVIINVHGFDDFMENPRFQRRKLIAIWKQLSDHYANQSESVFFEILNEPAGSASTDLMNDFYVDVLKVIRQKNPDRGVLVGPSDFNSVYELQRLRLPEDDKALIVTVHSYDPFPFTHQKATWTTPGVRDVSGIRFPGPPDSYTAIPVGAESWMRDWLDGYNKVKNDEYNPCSSLAIQRGLDIAAGYGSYYNRPIHLGEFGAFLEADRVSRANYLMSVRRAAEEREIGWAVWDWKANFAYWDRANGEPLPLLRRALFDRR